MRNTRSVGWALGALVLAVGACATSTGGFSSSSYGSTPSREASFRSIDFATLRDSLRAQAVAEKEGPGVGISVSLNSFASSRRVRATFHMNDDAYVLVGHLGPDGVVRVIFPTDPQDDGFVHGGKSYQLPEFFAGFEDQYRYRYTTGLSLWRSQAARYDSYDAGAGFVFIIAAWRPMRFDRFAEGGRWDSFEVADDKYMRDPRPAIYELATLLTGENREAYTVKFAHYTQTMFTPYYGNSFVSAFCLGEEPIGYSFNGFGSFFGSRFYGQPLYGSTYGYFSYGSLRYVYSYDAVNGCYRSRPLPVVQYATTGIGNAPVAMPYAPKPDTGASARLPGLPARPPRSTPIRPKDVVPGSTGTTSPEYRRRGLVTSDDDQVRAMSPRRREGGELVGGNQRPPIQEMVNHRREAADRGAQSGASDYQPGNRRVRDDDGVARRGGYTPPSDGGGSRSEPRTSAPAARSDPVERPTPTAGARTEPRSEPTRSVPAASPPPPASPPPAASSPPSSSSGSVPIRP